MGSRFFSFILCFIFIVSLPCFTASGTASDVGLVRVRGGTTLYNDADLTKAIGILHADAYVYAREALASSAGEVIEIVFLKDFIIRYAYIPLMSAAPLTPSEKAAYASDSADGILIRPGISLINIEVAPLPSAAGPSALPVPSPVPDHAESTVLPVVLVSTPEPVPTPVPGTALSSASSETAVPSVTTPEATVGAVTGNDPEETPLPPVLPSSGPSFSPDETQPAADAGDPENTVPENRSVELSVFSQYAGDRLKAVPTGRYYLLNEAYPVPAGRMIRSITLYPMSTGHAQGTISILYESDGKYQVAFSKDFSLIVPYSSPWETVIPLDLLCENDAFVTVCFNSSCTARYGMAADENGFLSYFSDNADDPLMLTVEGFAVNYTIRYE